MKKNIKLFLLTMFLTVIILTGCNSNEKKEKDDSVSKENEKGEVVDNKIVVDDENITIKYLKREHKKVPGMMNNQRTVFNLPTILVNITNNMDEKIHLVVHTSKDVDTNIDYAYSLTNENGVIDSTGTIIGTNKNLDVNIIYEKIRDIQNEYPLESFDNKIIYLDLYVADEYGTLNKFLKTYELNGNDLK
ncbi:MAG: hypothetical protein IJ568_06765 [Bacilli bacterium]|nr:hypothetical protein [Bacilli bacterium]